MECKEIICNPLCAGCLAKEMRQWLDGTALNTKIQQEINAYILKNEGYEEGSRCIICRNNYADICPYCLTEHVYEFLKRVKVNKKILAEFFEFFNFDFGHSGYSKDFEEDIENWVEVL